MPGMFRRPAVVRLLCAVCRRRTAAGRPCAGCGRRRGAEIALAAEAAEVLPALIAQLSQLLRNVRLRADVLNGIVQVLRLRTMKAIDARAGSRIKLPAAGGALGKPAFFLRLRPACKVSDAVLRIRCAFFFALHRFGTILFPTAFSGCIRADKIRRRFYYMFFGDKVNGESVNYSADMHRNAFGRIALHIHFHIDKDRPA